MPLIKPGDRGGVALEERRKVLPLLAGRFPPCTHSLARSWDVFKPEKGFPLRCSQEQQGSVFAIPPPDTHFLRRESSKLFRSSAPFCLGVDSLPGSSDSVLLT